MDIDTLTKLIPFSLSVDELQGLLLMTAQIKVLVVCFLERVRDIPTGKSQMLNAQSALKKSHARLSSSFGGRLGWKGLQPIIIVTYCSNCVEVRKRFCKLAAILLHHGTMDCCCLHAY